MPRGLTPMQRAFANELAAGVGPSEAFRRAYRSNLVGTALSAAAARAKRTPAVSRYLAELHMAAAAKSQVNREDKLRILSEMIQSTKLTATERQGAVKIHNSMTGDDAPQQVQVFGLSDLLGMVRQGKTG